MGVIGCYVSGADCSSQLASESVHICQLLLILHGKVKGGRWRFGFMDSGFFRRLLRWAMRILHIEFSTFLVIFVSAGGQLGLNLDPTGIVFGQCWEEDRCRYSVLTVSFALNQPFYPFSIVYHFVCSMLRPGNPSWIHDNMAPLDPMLFTHGYAIPAWVPGLCLPAEGGQLLLFSSKDNVCQFRESCWR